ncbi:MAG TPA: DUF3488 and transglutaminase-like domain-containing protein [Candidatus Hydrogenedentes bacterium]|jgi:hypothetical protein|nr:DUF3488 and transglutaminase-like domain-containing protein [Candidatus Hydrogenedentota bacterium]HOM47483.1 DUF3488 and transglutaminase-like domain-containing protein [Candidatus Hydrogenedentota bacterium]HOR51611.1 DUF3488 and transglutaminase-like domain-containing protein [Candidatus Hydrogenedentota bacterium]HPX87079.1 DUF3488 and transglutaminase-like domain-containing protein [Candidatus Hydrogenedentota bacterium]
MDKRLHFVLRIATMFLVLAGYLALASVRRYGLAFLFFPAAFLPAMPLGEWLERKSSRFRLFRKLVALAWLLFIPFSLQIYGLLDAVIFLVIFIQFYLITGEKSARIYYEIYLMAFFLLLGAVVQSPEPLIAIAFFLFSVASVWAFSLVKMYHDQISAPVSPLVELYRKGRKTARPERGGLLDSGFLISMTALSVLSLVITILSFLFTPRVEAGWLGRQDFRPAFTGISETVRIKGATSIYEDPSVVMHVQLPEEEDRQTAQRGGMYWRITTLSRFQEDEWSRRGLQSNYEPGVEESISRKRMFAQALGGRELVRKHIADRPLVQQVIFMDEVPEQGVPVFDTVMSLTVEDPGSRALVAWDGGEDFTVHLQTTGSRRLQYRAISELKLPSPDQLRASSLDYSYMDSRDFNMLTYQDLLPETLEKVRAVTASASTMYDRIQALNRWLSGEDFLYSLTLPPLPEKHGIDAFILEFRRGHCELYATALALMVRSLGVPARVVSGYRGGDYSAADDAYLIRASMSHLWVEVLFPESGWVRFDPSPRSDDTLAVFGRMRMAWSLYMLRAKMFWFQDVVGFQGGVRLDNFPWPWKGRSLFKKPEPHQSGAEKTQTAKETRTYFLFNPTYYGTALVIAFAGIFFILYQKWRNREKLFLTSDQQRARQVYLLFLQESRRAGFETDNATPDEVLGQLQGRDTVDYKAALQFVRKYEAARFGRQSCEKSFRHGVAAIFRRAPLR